MPKDEEPSLPKATTQKILQELLPADLSIVPEARNLFIDCCAEFIRLISSEANEIMEQDIKKMIGSEHVVRALKELGFEEYIEHLVDAEKEYKVQMKSREKRHMKLERSGLSEEELLRKQEELFGSARERFIQKSQHEK